MRRPAPTLLLAALLSAPPARAQVADSARVGARPPNALPNDGCTYDACALRVEEGAVVQGADGRPVGSLGVFGNVGRSVPWRSDAARRYAQSAQAQHRGARFLQTVGYLGQLAGVALFAVAAKDAQDRANADAATDNPSGNVSISKSKVYTSLGVTIGGSLLGTIGGAVDSHARKLLSRAVWWNNRELAQAR